MNKQSALALAEEYIGSGIPVFFLDLNTKAPVEPGLRGFEGATLNPDELVERINRINWSSNMGVGLHPGGGGYIVLDVDDKNGHTGTANLQALMYEVGAETFATAEARTPSGGLHIWFKKDDFVGNADLVDGVNVRADAGYVVAPGQYRADGTGWVWEANRLLDKVVTWPDWLKERLGGQGKQTGGDHWQELTWDKVTEEDRLMAERLMTLGFKSPSIQNGSVYLVAPHKINGVGASVGYIGPGIAKIWDDSCKIPDGRVLPHEEVFSVDELDRWLETGQKDPIIKLKGPEIIQKRVTGKGRFKAALTSLDVIENMRPPEFLIESWLPRGSLCMLYAGANVGKTFLAIDWMFHLSTGTDWQGFKVKKPVKSLYIIAEGASGFGLRTKAWRQEHPGLEYEDVKLLPVAVNLASAEEAEELVEIVEECKPGVIFIDTWARSSVGADENSNKDMSIVINNAVALQEASPGCTVVIIHHIGHTNKDRARGASAIYAALDASFRLEGSTRAGLTLFNDKQKEAELAHPIRLNMRKVELDGDFDEGTLASSLVIEAGEDLEGEEEGEEGTSAPQQALQVADALWRMPNHTAANKDWMAKTGMANGMFSKWKNIANELGLVKKTGEGKNDPWVATCDPYATYKMTVVMTHREATA